MSILEKKNEQATCDIEWDNPKTTHLVLSCRENGPKATTKNHDYLETWKKEKTRLLTKNLVRWDIYSHEWKRYKNGRMEQSKEMEYGSRKVSSEVLKLRYLYIYIYIYIYERRLISNAYSEISRKRDHVFKQTKVGSKVQYFSYKLTYLFFDIVTLYFNTFFPT